MIETVPPTAGVDDIVDLIESAGVVIIDRLLEQEIGDVVAELQPRLRATRPGGGAFFGHQAKRLGGVVATSPTFARCLVHPTLTGVSEVILGPFCDRIQLTLSGALEVWPGGTDQPLHRDESTYGTCLRYGPHEPEYVLSLMVAGTDFTADNGATRVVPGSHRWDRDRAAKVEEVSTLAMARGSVALWLGSTLHGMGTNRSDQPRTGVVAGYTLGWLRQEENQYLACPPDVAAGLPESVQQLLGYQVHSPLLGWVTGRDPDLLLRPGRDDDRDDAYAAAAVAP